MLSKATICFLLLLGFIFAKEVKVGYVDSDRIIKEFRETSEAKRTLDEEIEKYRKTGDSLKTLIDSLETAYESQKLMLSEAGKEVKSSEIEQLKRRYTQYLEEVFGKGGKLEQKNRELVTPIIKKINDAVEKVAQEDGFTIVFDAAESKIIYAEVGLDLTDRVVAELNKEYRPIAEPKLKKRVLVLPLFEENQEAQDEKLGAVCRSHIQTLLAPRLKVRMIPITDADQAMNTRNILSGTKIEERDAYDIGRELQADYIIVGKVFKRGKRISLELTLLVTQQQMVAATERAEVPRIEELRTGLGNLVAKLYKKIEQEQ